MWVSLVDRMWFKSLLIECGSVSVDRMWLSLCLYNVVKSVFIECG